MIRVFSIFVACIAGNRDVHGDPNVNSIKLVAGWNSISFLAPPKSLGDMPEEAEWIVVPRAGKFYVADLKGGQQPLDVASLLPPEVGVGFSGTEPLEINSVRQYEGCLIFCRKPTEFRVSSLQSVSLSLPEIPADTWVFTGVPIGAYGSPKAEDRSSFLPPNNVPFLSFFSASKGQEPVAKFLSRRPHSSSSTNDLKEDWKDLPLGQNSDWRNEWKLRQDEAIWVKTTKRLFEANDLFISAVEDVKIEIERLKDDSTPPWSALLPKSVILSLGSSLSYIDVKLSLNLGDSPSIFRLEEVDWFKAPPDWYTRGPDNRPTKEKLHAIIRAAAKELSDAPGEGFEKITKLQDEPKIEVSQEIAVLPYLESTHGPWSYSRSLRINTQRLTKGVANAVEPNGRILEPGIYLGRLKLRSSAKNNAAHPTVIILMEVPELYGGYEGSLAAQVLSIRGDKPRTPREFVATETRIPLGGQVPFEKLLTAVKPGSRSIQIGTFPLRLRILPNDVAEFLSSGSFIVKKDLRLGVKYDFLPLHSGFHAIDVKLDGAKKTLLLTSTAVHEIPIQNVPILAEPLSEPRIAIDKDSTVPLRRHIQVLLQEEASGYLRGVFIERLGRSSGEGSDGTISRRMRRNDATNEVENLEQEIWVLGEVNLFRSSSKDQEEALLSEATRQ